MKKTTKRQVIFVQTSERASMQTDFGKVKKKRWKDFTYILALTWCVISETVVERKMVGLILTEGDEETQNPIADTVVSPHETFMWGQDLFWMRTPSVQHNE